MHNCDKDFGSIEKKPFMDTKKKRSVEQNQDLIEQNRVKIRVWCTQITCNSVSNLIQ